MRTRYFNAKDWSGQPIELFVEEGRFTEPGPADSEIDLNGSLAMPGFIDAHCHILPTGLDMLKLNLDSCQTPDDVLQAVADWHRETPDGWLHAVLYDQTKFPGARHLTRHELDRISADRPILLRAVNGHASIANSAALREAGVTRETRDPKGGEYVRDADGEPNGVLLERAHEFVTSKIPEPSLEEMVEAILAAGRSMSALGITCASDMMTGRWNLLKELEAYRLASERGCPIRLRLAMQWATVIGPRGAEPAELQSLLDAMNPDLCRAIALKVFADGAIGSATAAIHSTYRTTGKQGQLIYDPEKLHEIITRGAEAGWPVIIHSIGDRATDLVMDAVAATDDPSRHRIEHVIILSDAQIARLKEIGCQVTMQPEFLHWFGHTYQAQLSDEISPHLKRARSVLDAGIPLSFNSDRPIVGGDPWLGIWSAVNRPAGFAPDEAVTVEEAIHAYTAAGASANFDSDQGRLEPGFHADFQVYSQAPERGQNLRPDRVYMGGGPT